MESLTSEGILGLDFLEKYECIIDAANGVLTLGDSGLHIQLQKATRSKSTEPALPVHVCLDDTIVIPPRSEVLTFATTSADVRGTWLVDEQTTKNNVAVRVARAIVHPQDSKVPVCLLNPRDVPVTMYKGMTIGEIEELRSNDVPVDNVQKANTVTKLDPKKRQMLLSLAETIGAHVSKEEQVQFSNLLLEYGDIFASSSTDLGRTGALKHCIKTGDSNPISQPVRRLPPHRKEQVNKLLHEMQENDIIHPSSSPWASPIVLVQKKDGSVRFCIDYRKLNAVTTKDAYPLPRIDDTLDTLCGSKWFSTLDLLSGYWQVEMSPEDRHKTAFCTPQGLFEFKVMPFGLCNAPATFQRLMDLVLAGLQWSKCLVYLDDVILLGTTFGEHLDNIRAVFDRIRQVGLKLRADKCCFLQRNVKYLGHLVGVDGLQADPDKVGKVTSWPVPQSAQQVQQFLGFANYYRRFIQGFAEVAKPLHRLTEHAVNFSWTAECQEAFENLRSRLTRAPILAFPDYTLPFVLDTDASDLGIGAVLSQVSSLGQEQVVAYGSRLLSKAERNYSVTRRELLAVVTFTRLPIDLMYGTECGNSVTKTVPEYVTKLSEAFVEAYAAVRDTMGAKLQRQKEFYNKKVHGDPHKPGDFVLLFNPAVPKGGSRKFHSPWTGPFKIVERVSEATYHIQNTVDGKTSIVHFDRLKRCRPDIRTNIKQTKKDNSPTCGSTAGKDPPGTHMELLDDDQPTHVPEHPQPNAVLNEDPEPEEGPEQDDDDPHIIVPQPGTATRYPTRQRRAPDYY